MSQPRATPATDLALRAYLLGTVEFDDALALQRQLVFEVSGDRDRAALVVCEHPPLITVGREGSRAHVLFEPDELRASRWRVRWVNRGGGCLLHGPGQMAVYPVLPLDRLGLGLGEYVERLQQALGDVLADFSIEAATRPGTPGLWVGGRAIAHVGVAVCDWVTYYGAALNVQPDLGPFRKVLTGPGEEPMTSLERERHGPPRAALVRERFLEFFAARFGFARTSLFFHHPALGRRAPSSGQVIARG